MGSEHNTTAETQEGNMSRSLPTSSSMPSSPTGSEEHHVAIENSQSNQHDTVEPSTGHFQTAESNLRQSSALSMPPPPRPGTAIKPQDDPVLPSIPSTSPDHQIDEFDWLDVQDQHDHVMREFASKESQIMDGFEDLGNYFQAWASSIPEQEGPRSSKRLKTQIEFVQYKEHELEAKRVHYIKVVKAFENALKLF